jgi:hypothetical protein
MRALTAFTVLALLGATFFLGGPAARAETGDSPWCAVVNTGMDNVEEHCVFRTLEECVPFVIAGNRGFCNKNPRYPAEPDTRPWRHRVR